MSALAPPTPKPVVHYPDSDGKPMAENTLQFQWITTIQGNLDGQFRDDPNVFVAGDNLIYPVKGDTTIRQAPDVYVAFGRPKGRRGSYRVFDEGGVFPQVVFEVLSPGNRPREMAEKLIFYDVYGAEEYYVFNPDRNTLLVYVRGNDGLDQVETADGFVSPRLGIRFDLTGPALVIRGPDGKPFRTFVELDHRADRLAAKLRELGVDPETV